MRQDGHTSKVIFTVPEGDRIVGEIEGLGSLQNWVQDQERGKSYA